MATDVWPTGFVFTKTRIFQHILSRCRRPLVQPSNYSRYDQINHTRNGRQPGWQIVTVLCSYCWVYQLSTAVMAIVQGLGTGACSTNQASR